MEGRGVVGERGQGCAQGGPDVSAAAGASGKVCLGGERRVLAARQQLSRGELVESGALRVPGRSACSETSFPPRSPGVREARVVERSQTRVGTLGARDWPDLTNVHRGEVAPALSLSFPAGVGRWKA